MSEAWRFKNDAGMVPVRGKPGWPAMLRIDIGSRREAIRIVRDILGQIEDEHDPGPVQVVLVGELARETDDDTT